jgi:hypothetical protein
VPETLAALLNAQIQRFPIGVRQALLAAASLSTPDSALIAGALGREASDALAVAEEAGVIDITDNRIRFSHPLLASAVYSSASAQRRRALIPGIAEMSTLGFGAAHPSPSRRFVNTKPSGKFVNTGASDATCSSGPSAPSAP